MSNNYTFSPSSGYVFSDKCPKYKTKEQYEMFIKARKEDIKNINKAIDEAEKEICLIDGSNNYYFRSLAKKFLNIK